MDNLPDGIALCASMPGAGADLLRAISAPWAAAPGRASVPRAANDEDSDQWPPSIFR